MARHSISRRQFLGGAATAAGLAIVPRRVLGGPGLQAPSDTITGALVGNGNRGRGTWGAMRISGCRRLATCDVDTKHLGGEPDGKSRYVDYRRLMDRQDIDVVAIATPPHWHALITIAAFQSGKDVFCEKPMTKFIAEGRAMADACRKYGRVFQIGTFGRFGQSRSRGSIDCHKIIQHRLLDDLSGVVHRAGVPMRLGRTHLPPQPVPKSLDYDLWLGPAPYKPYHPHRVHYSNRFYWDYEGGDLTNFGAHRIDPFTWTFAKDHTAPVRARPHAQWPQHPDAVGPWAWVELTYADGLRLILQTGKWGEGYDRDTGKRSVGRGDLDEEGRKKLATTPDPEPLLSFENAVRTRGQAGGNAEAAHRGTTALHLANIAIRVGREVRFDPETEQVVGDEEANRLAYQPMRAPWHL
ncbi:MAG: Gfo/Idh/MocA family oxidoreductase [Candidatus Brocadiia bacterium]